MDDESEGDPGSARVKVTVEVTGHGAEVRRILDAVAAALADEALFEDERRPGANAAWWTPERAAAFARRLKPPALHALHVVAERAPVVRVSVLQREMQRSGRSLTPGALSSIGFAVRALGAPQPFVRDNYQRVYRMDPTVAAALLPAVEAEQARRRPVSSATEEAVDE